MQTMVVLVRECPSGVCCKGRFACINQILGAHATSDPKISSRWFRSCPRAENGSTLIVEHLGVRGALARDLGTGLGSLQRGPGQGECVFAHPSSTERGEES